MLLHICTCTFDVDCVQELRCGKRRAQTQSFALKEHSSVICGARGHFLKVYFCSLHPERSRLPPLLLVPADRRRFVKQNEPGIGKQMWHSLTSGNKNVGQSRDSARVPRAWEKVCVWGETG